MSPVLDDLQSQWLAQMAEMRAAISSLNLSKDSSKANAYAKDLNLLDEEFEESASSEDLWDSISDFSAEEEELDVPAINGKQSYDQEWLARRCDEIASRDSGVQPELLLDQVMAVLHSDSSGSILVSFVEKRMLSE